MALPTVWVVDDDEDDQLLIRSAFVNGERPISVLTLSNGAELLRQLADCTEPPSLILLDINMPVKNGFETLLELRSITDYGAIPVVMLTTSTAEADRNRSLALGANAFLTKPLRFDQLTALAQQLSRQWFLS